MHVITGKRFTAAVVGALLAVAIVPGIGLATPLGPGLGAPYTKVPIDDCDLRHGIASSSGDLYLYADGTSLSCMSSGPTETVPFGQVRSTLRAFAGGDLFLSTERTGTDAPADFRGLAVEVALAGRLRFGWNGGGDGGTGSSFVVTDRTFVGQGLIGTISWASGVEFIGGDRRDRFDASAVTEPVEMYVEGRGADDDLRSGPGSDTLWGGAGADRISTGDGNDEIWAGDGTDTVAAGPGADTIYGGENGASPDRRDLIDGGEDDDLILAEDGNDLVTGAAGDDEIYGGVGGDEISGGEGDDELFGEAGDDVVRGEAGDDTVDCSLSSNGDTDACWGGAGDDTIAIGEAGGAGEFVVGPGDGANDVTIASGLDLAVVLDYLDRAAGARVALDFGNDGTDTCGYSDFGDDDFHGSCDLITEVLGSRARDVLDASAVLVSLPMSGRGGRDDLVGTPFGDELDGGAGKDLLLGGGGDDGLVGGRDDDTLFGQVGDDEEVGGRGNDRISGGDGEDRLEGGIGDDQFHGDEGDDLMIGGRGRDLASGDGGEDDRCDVEVPGPTCDWVLDRSGDVPYWRPLP